MKKKEECEHDWVFIKSWRKELDIADIGHILIPVKCSICNKRAFESYEQIGYEDEDGEEIE